MLLRFILLLIYIAGFAALRWYLRKHPPGPKKFPVIELAQPQAMLLWMWGPLLWFLPGLMWVGVPSLPDWGIVSLSLFAPLGIFVLFLLVTGLFPKSLRSPTFVLVATGILVVVALIVLLTLGGILSDPELDVEKFLLFLIFITIPPVIAILLLLVGVAEIVPLNLDQENRWLTALKIFAGFFTSYPKPTWVVEDGKVENRIKGNPFLGFGPGWLMTEPENVVVLQGGTDIKGIVGPGVVLTKGAESPFKVIDLRNQIRTGKLDGVTRDGIQVKLPIGALFRMNPGSKTINLKSLAQHELWPYQKQDVYKAVFSEVVDPAGKTPLEAHRASSWDALPLKVAVNRLKQVASLYSFDQLYSIDQNANTLTRLVIGKAVRETVTDTIEPLGYKVLGGGVGNTVVPVDEDVSRQQIDGWKARWINKTLDWQAETQIKQFKTIGTIRSQARVEFFGKLLEDTYQDFQDPASTNNLVAYHLLENLLHIARSPQVQNGLSESALSTLIYLQQQTREESRDDR